MRKVPHVMLMPVRFLCLVSHVVILATLFWSLDANVIAGLPLSYEAEEFLQKKQQFAVGLAIGAGFALFELITFIAGISMFCPSQMLISIATHFSATISLVFFMIDVWDCDIYWWIFGFCSALPFITEVIVVIGEVVLRKQL